MKLRISTKILLILLTTSLIPLSIVGFVGYRNSQNITQIAAGANQEIAQVAMSDSTDALSQELKTRLNTLAKSMAGDINETLVRVQADTSELADFATYLYNHKESLGKYPYPSIYGKVSNGAFGSVEKNQNSWLMASTLGLNKEGEPTPELMEEIYLTEFLDIKFRSIAKTNPYAVQLYFNTASQLSRGMPFINGEYVWINGTEQFPADMDLSSFGFYYLADETHNPNRTPVWTELYWDPAGLGWMVSSIAPVYQTTPGQKDKLKGVAGIDITLGKMIDEIINVQVEKTGFAFLMSESGQAIAFPERAADFLGFEGSLEGDFGNDQELSFFLTEAKDTSFKTIIQKMQAGEEGLTTYTPPFKKPDGRGVQYLFAYQPIPLTYWSVGIVVPFDEVIAPAIATNEKITANMQTASQTLQERSQSLMSTFFLITGGIVVSLLPVSILFSKTISNPIQLLSDGSRRIGAGDLAHRITLQSGDEIENLAKAFNQMAGDLQDKIGEIEAANTELRKLDELKSQFISIASHELRTPLIAIQGYVDLLRNGKGQGLNEDQKKMLDTVSRNATRLARIVSELLDISRIEENKLVLREEIISIDEIIREVIDENRPSLDKRGHNVTIELQPNLPKVLGDRDRLAQVIINLLGNAIKYTPDGGHIQIKGETVNDYVHLSVSDNGIGIKTEHIGQLFKRFSTVGDVTKHRTSKEDFLAGGTGLGLSIVEGIIKAHGGRVWVESEYSQGSTFHINLPIATDNALAAATAQDFQVGEQKVFKVTQFERAENRNIIKNIGRLKILIIDDEEDALEVTQSVLAESYEVIAARTSATGLKEALSHTPDLILIDAWIPGISGYDVCKTLKRNVKTKEIPIIFVTAAAQSVDEERAQIAGADGFVSKPFKKDDLINLIESFRTE
ncbi:MAG: response regulator [Anaerolineales bacterium]|nr:response regulator [Anaerolineales bacterium]